MPNRLTGQSSAYLRQHADNPVAWQPFDDAAFAEAARRDVPVFLSVGYAACHWCHVMAHESFEDPEIGAYLDEHFVPVKVDREERPDVDAVYMSATQLLTRQGGWPMSVFLTPDGRAFHAGTYFPPRPAHGMPSFRQVLEAVTEAWATRRGELEQAADAVARAVAGQAEDLRTALAAGAVPVPAAGAGPDLPAAALEVLLQEEDPVHGGFGGAPKFPPSTVLPLLERIAAGPDAPTAERARGLLGRTLGVMRVSALFDQVGGGFYRYSVTREWSLPHYEKMLYDNAQLLRAYARAAAREPGRGDDRTAADTAAFLLRELRLPGGAFASSLDADSPATDSPSAAGDVHSGEGAFYVWTRAELAAVLGPERGTAVADLMGVAAGRAQPLHPGRALNDEEQALWDAARPELAAARAARPAPARDDKVVAGWNGLTVTALAEAGVLLQDPALLLAAEEAAGHLWEVHWDGGRRRLARTSHAGSAERSIEGLLEDYALLAEAFLALYRATGATAWLRRARTLADAAEERFSHPDPGGGEEAPGRVWSDLADVPAPLLAAGGSGRAQPLDDVTPAGTAVLAGVLVELWALDEDEARARLVPSLLGPLELLARRSPRAAGRALAVQDELGSAPTHVVLAGGTAEDKLEARRAVGPAAVLGAHVIDADAPGAPGAARGKTAPGGRFTVYVCRGFACRAPVHTVAGLREELAAGG
ncbi:thioredoxin domain-containing protein [Kocuria turfanensis]|uniref:Thioredoxin domain-containing protein n=1 Tax=Kocuria turfanensis TaxID=388357 RepID=A0A512IGI7_9MICC|nr:thioredoxin domain-containing protein [Kocuria turfanensis]GEO96787.1 thioredoxin domain-containing protein [Kocuria turfanensis]